MIVENFPYVSDARIRNESSTLSAKGYRVSVICPSKGREPWHEIAEGVSIYRFRQPSFGGHLLEYACAFAAIAVLTLVSLIRDGFDVIHVANPPDYLVPMCALYKIAGKAIIYDQHDLCPELYLTKFGVKGFLFRILLLLERLSYQLADQVIVPNESYKEVALRRGQLAQGKVTVVRNGPAQGGLNSKDIDLGLRRKASTIVAYAGVIAAQDGLDYLCRALHCLHYTLDQEDFHCVLIGDGDALRSIKELVRKMELEERISFVGWISDPQVYARYLSTADICVAPEPGNDYTNRSTFVKILEYMAVGKPIVAFDLLETRRSAGEAALYADPNDVSDFAQKLTTLMTNRPLRQSMGELGLRRFNTEMAWQYSAPSLLGVYERLLTPSQRMSPSTFVNREITKPTPGLSIHCRGSSQKH